LQAEAEILGVDDDSDLAVIKVEQMPEDAHPLPLGDSDIVQVGDWAIAIGNPFGLGGSMTLGIISALGRTIPSGVAQFSIPQAIQTDAAINPGNSGGPLLNLDGEVIGVNAQIRTGGANANTGVGFAIPANVVRHVVPSLIANGAFQWPYLGIGGADLNLLIARANNLDIQQGAYITSVEADGPAGEAGLRGAPSLDQPMTGGDIVTEVDGQPIATFDDLLNYIAFKNPGDQITLTVLRDGQPQQITVTLGARPDLDVQSP
jgi:2-alkenal reductase